MSTAEGYLYYPLGFESEDHTTQRGEVMRKEQFIDALYAAGWVPRNDAQHMAIERLWRKLFPLVAELEDELNDAHAALRGEANQ